MNSKCSKSSVGLAFQILSISLAFEVFIFIFIHLLHATWVFRNTLQLFYFGISYTSLYIWFVLHIINSMSPLIYGSFYTCNTHKLLKKMVS